MSARHEDSVIQFPQREANNRPAARERIMPQSLEAEMSTLGSMMMERDSIIAAMELLTGDDFYRELHRKIWTVIVSLFEKGEPVDLITLGIELRRRGQLEEIGGAAYLDALIEACPSASAVETYAKAVIDASVLRQLLKASEAVSGDVYSGNFDSASEVVEKAEKRFIGIGSSTLRDARPIAGMEELIRDYVRSLHERSIDPEKAFGLKTGFIGLDNLTSGWQNTDLIIIAARPSMGKTSMMLQTCLAVAKNQKQPVVIFSLEMSKEQLVQRMVTIESQVDSSPIRKGKVADEDWPKIDRATEALLQLPIKIIDTPGMTTFEMRAQIRRVQKDFGAPSLIAVDYLQLAHHAGHNENRTQEISEIARTFKTMARDNGCPLIALSQLSRAVEQREDKRPILSDLRESGSIEAEADVVAFMYRPGYYKNKVKSAGSYLSDDEDDALAEVIVGKQRNGPTGTIKLTWRPEFTRFENWGGE